MKLQITDKNMAAVIATNVGDEEHKILRATPLFIKNFVMKMVFLAILTFLQIIPKYICLRYIAGDMNSERLMQLLALHLKTLNLHI